MPCLHVMQKDGGEGTLKVPRISSSLLALKTETEGGDGFGTWLFCKYSNTVHLTLKSMGQINCGV